MLPFKDFNVEQFYAYLDKMYWKNYMYFVLQTWNSKALQVLNLTSGAISQWIAQIHTLDLLVKRTVDFVGINLS